MMPDYPYASGDLLEQPNTYFYSKYGGAAFIDAWRAQRDEAVRWFEATGTAYPSTPDAAEPALALFATLAEGIERGAPGAIAAVTGLVQRFEVTKRVHGAYDERWRPLDREDYRAPERYVAFGDLLERTYGRAGRLPCLNALLKVNDIIGARRDALPPGWRPRAAALVRAERRHVDALAARARMRA